MMATVEWRSGCVDVGGVRIAFDVAGDDPPGRDTALLVMGLSTQCIFWPDEFVAALVDAGLRVVRFDNRDVGLSASVDRGIAPRIVRDFFWSRLFAVRANYTLVDMVNDTRGLLDHLEVARAHVVGISMGGIIAQMLAAQHPERVASLALIMSHTNHKLWSVPHPRVLLASGPPPSKASRTEIIESNVRAFRRLAGPAYRRTDDELRHAFTCAYDRDPRVDGMERQTQALFATPCIDPMLADIRAPTTVLHGTDDLLVLPVNSRRIARRIRGAVLTMFPGVGHEFPRPLLPDWARLIVENARRDSSGDRPTAATRP